MISDAGFCGGVLSDSVRPIPMPPTRIATAAAAASAMVHGRRRLRRSASETGALGAAVCSAIEARTLLRSDGGGSTASTTVIAAMVSEVSRTWASNSARVAESEAASRLSTSRRSSRSNASIA
ncbi:hypothetical protein N806_21440 [Rhodococcus sp. P27]|nr:hypothetical protein N806_21440 [Rhodococcus sp. P27]